MIRYALRCDNHHDFESWFQSAEAFEKLLKSKLVECPECASASVAKALMAPKVQGTKKAGPAVPKPDAPEPSQKDQELALANMRKQVEENSEYVGMNFAAEARAMHSGDSDARAIYGEAKPAEAKALIEDGVPVTPLPFAPKRKMN